jgi:hypothetical protein
MTQIELSITKVTLALEHNSRTQFVDSKQATATAIPAGVLTTTSAISASYAAPPANVFFLTSISIEEFWTHLIGRYIRHQLFINTHMGRHARVLMCYDQASHIMA